ncbi:MAG TPA: arginine--tRNA ligase [Solirubrobacteraceae bacterium]
MTAPVAFLTERLRDAAARLGAPADFEAARFVQRNRAGGDRGDVQVNAAFGLAKAMRRNPAEIAAELAEAIDASPLFAPGEVSGKAFVNFHLRDEWLVERIAAGELLPAATRPEHVLVDFSSPNVAKEMHVGHLRSTIIGDSLCRHFEARGHTVDRVSHVGDWGTQFGMLIRFLQEQGDDVASLPIEDLNELYKTAKQRFDADEGFRDRARQAVVELQSGEEGARRTWELLCERSRAYFHEIYDRLDVEIREVGESFYQPLLADVVRGLEEQGLLEESDGAKVVFVEGFTTREGTPLPLIIQKADGGYNYATTDLAAVRHRVGQGCDRMLYVVDHGQAQHFDMVFAVARRAGWLPEGVECRHIPFGLVLGEDGKRLRTRSGDSIPLKALLDQAEERGRRLAVEHDAPAEVGEHLGLSAIKYAELAHNRMTNYVFSFDKMVSLEGNTAPYMLYAYARIRGIVDRASGSAPAEGSDSGPLDDAERPLAKLLADFPDVVDRAMAEYQPSDVTEYLFALSQEFNRFYERARVVDEGVVDALRLRLCEATARTLQTGLGLLGVRTLERI